MTGGVVVMLGEAGRNIGAGMTGGLAYFLDEDQSFLKKVNGEIVRAQRIQSKVGEQQLKSLIQDHLEKTGSARAEQILGKWDEYLLKFWQVVPPSEKNTPEVEPEQTEPAKLEAVAN
jgi:glutamate synthase (ferredoxin)